MAAGAWTFTNGGRTKLLDGTFDIDSDTYKCALFLSTSNIGAASTTYAGVTNEHANANGYTTGGIGVLVGDTGVGRRRCADVGRRQEQRHLPRVRVDIERSVEEIRSG